MKEKILRLNERFEYVVVVVLLLTLMIVVLLGALGLVALIVTTLIERGQTMDFSDAKFTMPLLHDVFTGFLMILIGLELIKTIVMYLDDNLVHVDVVLSVAIIAIARHVIEMDLNAAAPLSLIGTGTVILALAVGYYYFKKAGALDAQLKRVSEE